MMNHFKQFAYVSFLTFFLCLFQTIQATLLEPQGRQLQNNNDGSNPWGPEIAGYPCQYWVNNHLFNLTGARKEEGDYAIGRANWNVCKFANSPDNNPKNAFAWLEYPSASAKYPMTASDQDPKAVFATGNGIKLTFESDQNCPASYYSKTQYTLEIQCDRTVMGQGSAKVLKVDYGTDPCKMEVVMSHDSGCPAHDTNKNLINLFFKYVKELDPNTKKQLNLIFTLIIAPIAFFGLVLKGIYHI